MGSNSFKHESLQDTASIVKYLEALGRGIEQNSLTLSTEDRVLELRPWGLVRLEVEAKRKDGEVKLNLKLRWTEPEHAAEVDPGSLSISARDAG